MRDSERAERIRSLVESFPADQAERDRLKQQADEALERFRRAVRELIGDAGARERASAPRCRS